MDGEQRLLERLLQRRSLQALIVALFSGLTAVFVLPFIALRLLAGEWAHALLDLVVVAIAVGGGVYCWRGGRADIAGAVLALLFLVTMVVTVHVFGPGLLVWAFPVTAATFFLFPPLAASAMNLGALLAVTPALPGLGPTVEPSGFVAALLATNALALVFAATMSGSRHRFRTLAERDPLTGAGNRRTLEPVLRNAIERCGEGASPVTLIAIDVDHFKVINDRHGHDVGDRVLVALTRVIRDAVRAGDDVIRYGGEELVVVAHGAPAKPSGDLAEVIRERIAASTLAGTERVTVSAGVAEARPGDTVEGWFRRADRLLYEAKRAGRNRVRTES